jgi:predicted phage terminase large subunit-like protein
MLSRSRSGVPVELFDMGRLGRQIRHASFTPEEGTRVVSIDTSGCTDDPRSDLSALVAGIIVSPGANALGKKELWVTDCRYGRFAPDELPRLIAQFVIKHEPQRALIEKINGSAFLRVLVAQEFERLGINPRKLTWQSARNKAAKTERISQLVRLSREDRLRLIAAPWNDEWLKEASAWLGTVTNSGRHEDCIDASAGLAAGIVAL